MIETLRISATSIFIAKSQSLLSTSEFQTGVCKGYVSLGRYSDGNRLRNPCTARGPPSNDAFINTGQFYHPVLLQCMCTLSLRCGPTSINVVAYSSTDSRYTFVVIASHTPDAVFVTLSCLRDVADSPFVPNNSEGFAAFCDNGQCIYGRRMLPVLRRTRKPNIDSDCWLRLGVTCQYVCRRQPRNRHFIQSKTSVRL